MAGPVFKAVLFASAPFIGMAAAGAMAAWWKPGRRISSYIQHLASGIVFGAVGTEVLPDVMHRQNPVAASIGFAVGVAAMLGIRAMSRRAENSGGSRGNLRYSLLAAVGVDVFVDGMLIGVGFAMGQRQGLLLVFALTGCAISLGLATASAILRAGNSRVRSAMWAGLIGIFSPIGAGVGALIASQLTGSWMEAVLAFTCAALLYLVAEELLLEAHETEAERETALTTATFFLGFLAILVADMLM